MKNHTLSIVGLLVTAIAGNAEALPSRTVTVTQTSDVNTLMQQNKDVVYFSQSGLSTEAAPVKNSAGHDQPLSIVAPKIIPSDWAIKPTGNFDNALVSWEGGISWPLIIRNIASDEAIFVHLDWVQKIASIHVPGDNVTTASAPASATGDDSFDSQAFRKAQRQRWTVRDDAELIAGTTESATKNLLEQYRSSQDSNKQYIKELNAQNDKLDRDLNAMKKKLEQEQAARESVEKKYEVLNPAGAAVEKDAVMLAGEFRERVVLPYDSSFDYFSNGGGHADVIDARTPATYIAKQGYVHEVLKSWADALGWHFEKKTNVNHKNPYESEFKGTFIQASTALVKVFERSKRPLDVQFIPNVKYTDPKTGETKHGVIRLIDFDYQRNTSRKQPNLR